MKKLCVVLFFLMSSFNLLAQNEWSIVLGINYSSFYDEDNNGWIPGASIGFEKDWQLIDNFGLNLQIIYSIKSGELTEKVIGPYGYYEQDLYLYNITARVGYLEIPISLKYEFYSTSTLGTSILMGYFISFPINDYTDKEKTKYLFTYDPENPEHKHLSFEYYPMDQSGFGLFKEGNRLNQGLILGVAFQIRNYIIEIRYTRYLVEMGYVDEISTINKRIHSFNLMFGINL